MLNKLEYYRSQYYRDNLANSPDIIKISGESYRAELQTILTYLKIPGKIQPLSGGTLGITYTVTYPSGTTHVAKTHLSGAEYRAALCKEAELLKLLYADEIYLKTVNWNEKVWMFMESLAPIQHKIVPDDIESILKSVQERAHGKDFSCLASSYTMEKLLDAAAKEREFLHKKGFFSDRLNQELHGLLFQLKDEIKHLPRCLCHGDLSNKNLMQKELDKIIVIDWEDSFWGIDGYDYLYWLTFFENRCFYSKKVFDNVPYSNDTIKGVLAMILIIKSAISYYSGSYLRNSKTFEDRIVELLGVFGDN